MLTGRNTMRINDLNTLSEGLQYHVSNNLPLSENIFRPGSEEFFRLIDEARSSFAKGNIDLDWFDQELLNTDIGTIVELANGEDVPLDIPFYEDEQLDEAVPVAAVIWVLKWVIKHGAWPVLKWLLKKHAGKIFGGAAIAYYVNQGWEWVEGAIGAEYAQMLIDNGFEIGMAVAFILGAVALKRIIERQGARLFKVNEALLEDEDMVNEIWGFAAGRSKKREPYKKVPEPTEPSIRDKVAARRKAAAKGDKDAWKATGKDRSDIEEASNTGTYRDEENNIDVKWQKLSNGSNEYFDIEAYRDGKRVEINNQQADHYIYMIKQDMDESVNEAEYQGKTVTLNTPKRGGSKKFYVYTKNKKGNVIKVSFGQQGMTVKTDNPGRVKAFVDRHDCKNKNDRTKAGYWSCRLPRYKSLGIKGGQWW
jgi:hypothetical protein